MQISKNIILKIFAGILGLNLTACNLPSPQNNDLTNKKNLEDSKNSAATFNLETVASRSTVLEPHKDGAFSIPTSKVISFVACLKDIYQNKPISGHKFLIEETQEEVSTDISGCLTWSEKITYNFLGDSQYIKLQRKIRGTGAHSGVRTASYAINPWSHGENLTPVLDLKNENAVPHLIKNEKEAMLSLKGLDTNGQGVSRSLWLDESRLFVTEQNITANGLNLLIELRGTPTIQLTKLNREVWPHPISEGTFKVRMKLIHKYTEHGKEIHRLITETANELTEMKKGALAINSEVFLPLLPTKGQVILGVELQPVGGPSGLTEFNGIYVLGEYDQLKGSSFLKLAPEVAKNKDFKVSNYINANIETVTENTDAYQKPKIEVAPLEFRFVRVGAENTSTREVIYNIKACLRSGIDQKLIRAQTFVVKKFNGSDRKEQNSVSLKTDNAACLNWDESIQFKYFECQKYLPGTITIENADLGLSQKLKILINPWDQSGSLGRDTRYVEQNAKMPSTCEMANRPKSQIILDSISYNTISYDYEVDNLLNLNVIKKIQLRTEPRLLLYSNLTNGRAETQHLRDGIYLLRLAIVRNKDYEKKSYAYVSSTEKIVSVLSGAINTEITFKTNDLKALGNRSTLLAELQPVDENKITRENNGFRPKENGQSLESVIDQNSNLENSTFTGPIVLNLDESNRPLRLLDDSNLSHYFMQKPGSAETNKNGLLSKIIADGLTEKKDHFNQQLQNASSEKYATNNNLSLINISEISRNTDVANFLKLKTSKSASPLERNDLLRILVTRNISKEIAKKLCFFWMDSLLPGQQIAKGGSLAKNADYNLKDDCIHAVIKNPESFFQIENRVIAKEVTHTQYLKGYNQGLTVGTGFSMNNSTSTNFTRSIGIGGKVGVAKKFLDFISGDIGVNISANWSESDSKSISNAFSVNAATSLLVQTSSLKIHVNKFEQCAMVRLNPLLFKKDEKWFGRKNYFSFINAKLNDDEKIQVITKGLMICEGKTRNQDYDMYENYYLIAQDNLSTQMQDNGDERNRNFFVALRSTNDFNRFVLAIQGSSKMPHDPAAKEVLHKDINTITEEIFKMKSASSPSMYLLGDGPPP